MTPDLICDFVLEQLTDELKLRETPNIDPLPTDSWIARSVMQKAIRRGMSDLACRAAAQLLLIDQRTLWRRLLITAMEDLGPAEIDTTARIVAAWRDRRWRSQVGGDWPVVAELVRRSAEAPKCQSANDLWNIAINDPALESVKADMSELDSTDVVAIAAATSGDIYRQAVAILLVLGSEAGCTLPHPMPLTPSDLFAALDAQGKSSHVTAICREAFRLTSVPLAGLTLCLWPRQPAVQSIAKDDWFGPAHWVGGIPTFALDQYTRAGKTAIKRYVSQSPEWRDFCSDACIAAAQRAAVAGEMLFRIDGAALSQRSMNPISVKLHHRSSLLGAFVEPRKVMEATSLMRRQLPLIEQIRGALFLTI
ncbi:hypothetical protein GVN18_42165 [Pseudomonas sp. ODNR1LW]|nr:hypothetical protein [Pseudomonas sp. ODNR1LW]